MVFFLAFVLCLTISPSVPVTITDHGYWKQYRVCYPPFNWSLPLGLDDLGRELFWAQPENWRHFRDTNISEHCGVVRVVTNGSISLPFPNLSNETHFINTNSTPQQCKYPSIDFLLVLTGHWSHYFQHFFDNLGPQLVLALDVLNMPPKRMRVLVDVSKQFRNVPKLWKRIGFKSIYSSSDYSHVCAKTLVMVESAPRVHPHFFERLRELLHISNDEPRSGRVLWISRHPGNSYFHQRFIWNELDVFDDLVDQYSELEVELYDHLEYSLDETIELFSEAKYIIGAHGGGMYNQFFAPKNCTIIEILPVRANGLYPSQKSFTSQLDFSHMAIWSNSLLIGQKFWRYYEVTKDSNFKIKRNKFLRFLQQIPGLDNENEAKNGL